MDQHHDKHSKRQRQDGGVCQNGKRYVAGTGRIDGQAATNESVYRSLSQDAWFPALYSDDYVDDFDEFNLD